MKYYALVNTAGPKTGFISVGEMLSDEQVQALGREKIEELVQERVIGCLLEDEEDEAEERPEDGAEDAQLSEGTEDAPMTDGAAEEGDEAEDDELPELDCADDVVSDAAQAETRNGRRKKK